MTIENIEETKITEMLKLSTKSIGSRGGYIVIYV